MLTLIYDTVRRYGLSSEQAARLWDCAQPGEPPAGWVQRLWRSLLVVAALLLGAGLIFWIAAQWPEQTRSFKLHVLQAAVALPVLVAALVARVRVPALLLATLALGGLLAFVGQTYQTGADAWQLFATWAALALVWVLVVRSDGLWALWLVIAGAALTLWGSMYSLWGVLHGVNLLQVYGREVLPWLVLWLLPLALPRLGPVALEQNRISRTVGAALALAAWTGHGMHAVLRSDFLLVVYLGTALLVALVLWQARRRHDMAVLGLGLLAANVLWLSGIGRWLFDGLEASGSGGFLLMTLLMAASVGGSVHWLYQQQKRGDA